MAGFCRRCGDIIRGSDSRCKCGGSSASSQVSKAMFEPAGQGGKQSDRWLKTYGERRSVSPVTTFAPTPQAKPPSRLQHLYPSSPSSSKDLRETTPRKPRQSLATRNMNTIPSPVVTPPTPSKSPPPTTCTSSKEVKRGLSVKSSARAHVRSLTANMPDSVDLSAAEEEVLTNVFGSVLDPHETRGRCASCQDIFKREGKIYPDPRREDESGPWAGVFYCRKCYVKQFSRGQCRVCSLDIVGDEGFVQLGKGGDRGLWHKRCFKCLHCQKDVSASPCVDLRGDPCCDDCFDKPTRLRGISSSTVTDIPDLRIKKISVNDSPSAKMMKPAVEEFRHKLRKAGIDIQPSPSVNSVMVPPPSIPPLRIPSKKQKSGPPSPNENSIPSETGRLPSGLDNYSSAMPVSNKASLSNTTSQTGSRVSQKSIGSASTQHVLSPSANPLCPTCKLPLFRPQLAGLKKPEAHSSTDPYQFGGTLATLPTTGETFHVECLTCHDCKGRFPNGKYIIIDSIKLCETCVAQRDLIAAQERLQKMKLDLEHEHEISLRSRSLVSTYQPKPRTTPLGPSFPSAQQLNTVTSSIKDTPMLKSHSASSIPRNLNKVSTSPFLGGDQHQQSLPLIPNNIQSPSAGFKRFGGQAICPGCSKPGTITETKPGPNNERWHFKCLACSKCQKPLDSGAKKFESSQKVGCRDCLDKEKTSLRSITTR